MIKGFSRLSKDEKREYIIKHYLSANESQIFKKIESQDEELITLIENFSENVISIFHLPFSIAPNFLIDNRLYAVPMVTEESSVVAAAASGAKFWAARGGFKTTIIGKIKHGQVHFQFKGNKQLLISKFNSWKTILLDAIAKLNNRMKARGGGILEMELLDKNAIKENYYQIKVSFNTCDAMGANYMNSCLEGIGSKFKELVANDSEFRNSEIKIIMAILSNYSPENAAYVYVECPVNQLEESKTAIHPSEFASKFIEAVNIANLDLSRAVTHNKGIFNGVDSIAIATGNDWRAIEANAHAFASSSGTYKSLSNATIKGDNFHFELTLPMQLGTVGGIASLHPLTKLSLKLLGNPSAEKLMQIIASVGLASNFAAIKALITTGIQKGHMKMHLSNILYTLSASKKEIELAKNFFKDKAVTHVLVQEFINDLRK